MKAFIRKSVTFLFGVTLVALVIQLLIAWRIKNKVTQGVDSLDLIQGQEYQLVLLGSSRCFSSFDPRLFEQALGIRAANLGVEGHSELTMQCLRLENYLAKNPAPKVAVLTFDPLVEAGSMTDNTNMVDKNEFARYAFWPSAANTPIVDYFKFDFLERNLPLYALLKYKQFMDCVTLPVNQRWSTLGYNKHEEQWDTLRQPLPPPGEMTRVYFDTTAAGVEKVGSALESLDSLCKKHNIRLICVQQPVYKTIYRKVNFQLTGEICSRLHIPFFDVCTPELCSDIRNFYDVDHCNATGTARLTDLLLSDTAFRRFFQPIGKDSVRPFQGSKIGSI